MNNNDTDRVKVLTSEGESKRGWGRDQGRARLCLCAVDGKWEWPRGRALLFVFVFDCSFFSPFFSRPKCLIKEIGKCPAGQFYSLLIPNRCIVAGHLITTKRTDWCRETQEANLLQAAVGWWMNGKGWYGILSCFWFQKSQAQTTDFLFNQLMTLDQSNRNNKKNREQNVLSSSLSTSTSGQGAWTIINQTDTHSHSEKEDSLRDRGQGQSNRREGHAVHFQNAHSSPFCCHGSH